VLGVIIVHFKVYRYSRTSLQSIKLKSNDNDMDVNLGVMFFAIDIVMSEIERVSE